MGDKELLRKILYFKRRVAKNACLKTADSILIKYLNNSSKYKYEYSRRKRFPLKFTILFFLAGTFFPLYFFAENILRLVFSPKSKANLYGNTAFVMFANSHLNVLKRIPFKVDQSCEPNILSSRTIKALTNNSEEIFYIDSVNSISITFKILKQQIKQTFKGHGSFRVLFRFFPYLPNTKSFISSLMDYYQSIRFQIWTKKLTDLNNGWKTMYYGNDTCYRAYWLIDTFNKVESHTIQHGIIENKIMYFSISNKFLCWDKTSFQLLLKNPQTCYEICGYPKFPMFQNIALTDSNRLLIIMSKITSANFVNKMIYLAELLKFKGIHCLLKPHPLEDKKALKAYAESRVELISDITYFDFNNVVVINSSYAIDLNHSNIPVIPIISENSNILSAYYNCCLLDDFITEVEETGDVFTLLNSMSQTYIECNEV